MVGQMFDLIAQKSQTAVEARNQVREAMGLLEPSLGARGSEYTDCYLLAKTLLTPDTFRLQYEYQCTQCDYVSAWMKCDAQQYGIQMKQALWLFD